MANQTFKERIELSHLSSSDEFRSVFESANDCMIFLDNSGRILDVNRKAVEIFGGTKQELLGKHFIKVKVVSLGDAQKILSAFAKILAGKKAYLTVHIKNMRGEEIDLECSGSLTKINDKLTVLIIARDITERKKAEETLRKSEEKYRSIVELAPDGIITSDVKGVITSTNTAFSKWTGYSKEEIVGKHFTKLRTIHARDMPKYVKLYAAVLRGKTPPPIEFVYYRKDGMARWGEAHAGILKEEGKIIGFQVVLRDITERKKAEEAIRDSEQKFERLFMGNPEAAIYWDLDFRILGINPRFTELFGYSFNEMKGKKPNETIVPEDKMEESNFLGKKAREGILYYDTVRKRKDASLVPVCISVAPIIVEGQSIGYVGLYKDITERKHAEEALRESEEKYRNLFENARDVIITFDLKGNLTSINKAAEEYGFRRNEMIKKNMLKFVPKKYWPRLLKELADLLRGNKVEGEIELLTPVGKKIAEYRSNPVKEDGKVVGFQTIMRDVTERKELEEKLRQHSQHLEELVRKRTEELLESEKRYSVLVEEARDIVTIIQDEKIAFINRKGSEVIGYSQEELIGLPYEKIVAREYHQLARESHKRRMRGEMAPSTYEVELLSKTGEHVPVEFAATRIDHQGRPASLIFGRDIMERKLMEEQHLKLEKLATMGELATMVAHDLRNPLTSIRNAGYYIKNSCFYRANAECKTTVEMLDIIEQETIFANNIINDLLDFAAKRPLQKKRQNINEIVEESLTKGNISRNIEVERNFAKKAIIGVDEKQLERVFLNLIKNAVQAMPDGGKLAVTTKETNDNVEMIFADTGIGISEENMSKLFTPLFTTKAKGIGMGLAICKNIVEQHNGTIEVKSKAGQGTTFTIKLPKKEKANNQ
jgi:PAS domain S-box-containing protein